MVQSKPLWRSTTDTVNAGLSFLRRLSSVSRHGDPRASAALSTSRPSRRWRRTERFASRVPAPFSFALELRVTKHPPPYYHRIEARHGDIESGLTGIQCRLHDLRRLLCTKPGEAGVPESTMLDIMGHVSAAVLRVTPTSGHRPGGTLSRRWRRGLFQLELLILSTKVQRSAENGKLVGSLTTNCAPVAQPG